MVTPTSYFLALQWLCCLLPIGYLPKLGSVGVRICHHHRIQQLPQVKVIFRYLRPDTPVLTSTNTQHMWAWCHIGNHLVDIILCSCLNIHRYIASVGMMTFRWSHRSYQSICQQHLLYSHQQVTLVYYKNCRGIKRFSLKRIKRMSFMICLVSFFKSLYPPLCVT